MHFSVLIFSAVLFKDVLYNMQYTLYYIKIEHPFTGVFSCIIFSIYRDLRKKAKNVSPDLCFLIFLVNYTSFYRLLKSKHYIFAKPNCMSQWMEDNMCKKLMTNYS